jgi:alkylation response protein AidB-like acyl-CoA dehydrogenase
VIVDLLPTDDQAMIEQGVVDFLRDCLPVERLREAKNHAGAAEREAWDALVELGLFGIGLAEEAGGLGLGLPEEALIVRAFGRYLASPSLLAQLVAPHLAGDEDLRAAIIAGTVRVAFANDLGNGSAHLIDGEDAQQVLLVDAGGAACLLPRDSLGAAEPVAGMDETVSLARIALPGGLAGEWNEAAGRVSLLICAYLTGLGQAATDMAVDYSRTREQFGQPIGAFQAIKHMCADMAARASAAEAQTFFTAVTFEAGQLDGADIGAARMLASDAAIANAKANIQIHGGMGFTAECDAHLFLKRAHLFALLGSSKAAERRRLLGPAQ